MADTRTKPTAVSVDEFIAKVEDARKRDDSRVLIKLMSHATGAKARMWGPTIVGFGTYHYKYDSGHEGDSCIAGFSPRKAAISIYLAEFPERDALLAKLGKHTMGKACLYLKKLDDIDMDVLKQLVDTSITYVKRQYPTK
ncbi:MAG: DUF1801 domain-containing protein [Gemmatimonadaceae bacterium]|nr:DUF1801 domain-containing protein [Gemmatimonadaceae bacterium]